MTDQPDSPPAPAAPASPTPAQPMSAAAIARMALDNLAKRAADGKPLSEADWARLNAAQQADKPDPLADLLAQAKEAKGKPSPALLKLAREALMRDLSQHVWPDVPAAAKELAVSVQTVRNWCDEAGIDHARTAISKAALYRALYQRATAQADTTAPVGSEADQREQALRIAERQARVDERTNRLVAVANDAGKAAVIAAVNALRPALLTRLPALLADTLAVTANIDRLAFEATARRLITTHLAKTCAALAHQDPPCPPQLLQTSLLDSTPST